MNLPILIAIVIILPVILLTFAVIMFIIGIQKSSACYNSTGKLKECIISQKSDCKGKYFETMSECTDYANDQPTEDVTDSECTGKYFDTMLECTDYAHNNPKPIPSTTGTCYNKTCIYNQPQEKCIGDNQIYYNSYDECINIHPKTYQECQKKGMNTTWKDYGTNCFCNDGWIVKEPGGPCSICKSDKACINGKCKGDSCKCDNGWAIGEDSFRCDRSTVICDTFNTYYDPSTNSCKCQNGWISDGGLCNVRTCINRKNCNNKGDCKNSRCVCDNGYIGMRCEKCDINNDMCINGVCKEDGICVCNTGWLKDNNGDCKVEVSCKNRKDCNNKGDCKNSLCVCDYGYRGINCQETLDCKTKTECNNVGVCKNGGCICQIGYTGKNCEITTKI
jgi:hypothetical protein